MYTDPHSPATLPTRSGQGGGIDPAPAGAALAGGAAKGMWTYAYKHGDRPLEGYTIERAAGRGGFGEVYYALSDAGREVALKSITGFEQIELRGIGQCMNLKSPHLVSIFDIRQNAEGRWFVIMEFVNGPSLRELLDASPAGLGPQKAAFFLREIAKGLSYLHDCGIVHRDLKPANIFFENGYVKIGDYGLSKAIEPTHHSGQTVTVGTVHYMAPEVGMGKYDRSIDIYALGALLYEMMTGIVPFVGASAGEILIKHLSHDADCSGIPEPFCSAIKRAMAKDPAQRFSTVQEMVEAVFGAEHVRNSVSQFSPTDLSMVAGRIAERITTGAAMPASAGRPAGTATGSSVTNPNGLGTAPTGDPALSPAYAAGRLTGQVLNGGRRVSSSIFEPQPAPAARSAPPPPPLPLLPPDQADPVKLPQRIALAGVAALVVATGCVAFDQPTHESDIWLYVVLSVLGGAVGLLFASRKWLPGPGADGTSTWGDRLALGAVGSAMSLAVAAPIWMNSWHSRQGIGVHVAIAAIALAVANPRRLADAARVRRINFRQVAVAAALAFVGAGIAATNDGYYEHSSGAIHRPGDMVVVTIAVIGGIALVTQVLASWDERRAMARVAGGSRRDRAQVPQARPREIPITPFGPSPAPMPATPAVAAAGGSVKPPPLPVGSLSSTRTATTTFGVFPPQQNGRPVPRWLTMVWFGATALSFAIAVALHVFSAMTRFSASNEEATFFALTTVAYAVTVSFFARIWKRVIRSWTSYLVLPAFRLVCAVMALGSWVFVANARLPNGEEAMFSVTVAVFAVCWIVTWVLPWLWRAAVPPREDAVLTAGARPQPGSPLTPSSASSAPSAPSFPNWPGVRATSDAATSTAYALGAAVGEVRSALKMPFGESGDSPTSRAEKWRRKSRLRRVRWAGRDRDVEHALRVAARFDRRKRVRERSASVMRPIGGLALTAGFFLAMAFAIDVPSMIAAGFPDAELGPTIARDVFGGHIADWPRLAEPLLALIASVVMFVGLVGTMIGRRHAGGLHMLRAMAGVGFLVLAVLPIAAVFYSVKPWHEVAMLPMQQRNVWLAARTLIDHSNMKAVIVPLLTAAFGAFLLALPPRRQTSAVASTGGATVAAAANPSSTTASATPAADVLPAVAEGASK